MIHTNIPDGLIILAKPSYDAEQPIFPGLTIWRYYPKVDGSRIFPSIEPPTAISTSYQARYLGQDFDGSLIGIILDGPEIGRTFYEGFRSPTIH